MRSSKAARHAVRRSRRPWVFAAGSLTVVGATVVGTGVVNASVSSHGPGIIHACVADAGGAVRIIGGDECRADERFVAWASTASEAPGAPRASSAPPDPQVRQVRQVRQAPPAPWVPQARQVR